MIQEKWEEIKQVLKKEYELTDISYNTWIVPLKFYKLEGNTIKILVPSDLANALNYINNKYKTFFQVTISEMFDDTYDINFILEKDINIEETDSTEKENRIVFNINHESANLNPRYTFDTFVVGSNNRFAQSASLAVAETPGSTYNPLYIYGGPGLGKTHLMHSIGHFILNDNPDKKVLYVTCEQFTNEVIDAIRAGNTQDRINKVREKYRNVDVLLIDDIQFLKGKQSTQEEFFHTFNQLHTNGKQIVISSDKPPKLLEDLDERFLSRFEWGLIVDIQPPDYETRIAILRKIITSECREMDEEIIHYIGENMKSNVRELEGALKKVFAYAKINHEELTLDVAKEALKDVVSPDKPKELTPSLIIDVVAEHYDISVENICSKKRNADYVLPRQIIMYLLRQYTDCALVSIGKLLGGRDHTTVMHGVDKVVEEMKTDSELAKNLNIICKKLEIG